MISSIIYEGKSRIALSTIVFPADKCKIIEICLFKVIILVCLFIFPPLIQQEILSFVATVCFSLEFWISKNLGRKFLNASWFIDTEKENDEWVYEAGLKSPSEIYESIFWYSFIVYGLVLIPIFILSLTQDKLSLACAILIGVVANYINFYAFSNIITMRNEGILQLISDEAVGEGIGETIKLPMIYKSKLEPIKEQLSK